MIKYHYNGVELPELPERDEIAYPYAVLGYGEVRENVDNTKPKVFFITSKRSGLLKNDNVSVVVNIAQNHTLAYEYDSENNRWVTFSPTFAYAIGTSGTVFWSNYDVYATDNTTLLFPASDPVPVGGEPTNHTEWQKQDAYKPNTEWNGKTFYRMMGGKWVKQDAVSPSVVEVEPDVPEPDVPQPDAPKPYTSASASKPFTLKTYNKTKNWDGTLYYSTDEVTWNEWDGTTTLSSAEHNGEHCLYMRGVGNSYITGENSESRWVLSGSNIQLGNNIENLLDYETVAKGEHPVMAPYCFAYLFYNCTTLSVAPELPATTLSEYCYHMMFCGCNSLTTAPELPATTLATECYFEMFYRCDALTVAPELPATTLASSCYEYMFAYCKGLTRAPSLPATKLVRTNCYASMFKGCTALTTIPALPATELLGGCYWNMFEDCRSIKISRTQSDEYPNEYRIPTVGDCTVVEYAALSHMFKGTGGTVTDTPSANTTYYTANEVV